MSCSCAKASGGLPSTNGMDSNSYHQILLRALGGSLLLKYAYNIPIVNGTLIYGANEVIGNFLGPVIIMGVALVSGEFKGGSF
jgi:hypothetical protein